MEASLVAEISPAPSPRRPNPAVATVVSIGNAATDEGEAAARKVAVEARPPVGDATRGMESITGPRREPDATTVAKSASMTKPGAAAKSSSVAAAEPAAPVTASPAVTSTSPVAAATAAGPGHARDRPHSQNRSGGDGDHLCTHHGVPPFVATTTHPCRGERGPSTLHRKRPVIPPHASTQNPVSRFYGSGTARWIRIRPAPPNTQITNATVPDE